MKIAFYYNTQYHQILHSLPVAFALSALRPDFDVCILASTQGHLDFIRGLQPLYPEARVQYRLLDEPAAFSLYRRVRPFTVAPKLWTLWHNRRLFDSFDAIVLTEKTSLNLKRFGVTRPKFIHTAHGAGDRATAVDKRIAKFDFALTPGPKTAKWLLELGIIRPGHYAVGAYAKFDLVRRLRQERAPLFPAARPTILYNPHFRPALSSWPDWGFRILDQVAASDRFNLIFAPHVRLFDPPTPDSYAPFARYRGLPHMLIDLGSTRSIDMTYVTAADLYMGDVSSQVYEFLLSPRPCLFLNAHGVAWQGDDRYRFWTLGPVVDDVRAVMAGLDDAFAREAEFRPVQTAAVAETFDLGVPHPARHNAEILADFLDRPGLA